MEYYGTLGPACAREEIIRKMIRAGMTGLRINLSHGGLDSRREWIRMALKAAEEENVKLQILIDLEGPELRIGQLAEPLLLEEGETVPLESLRIPSRVLSRLEPGDELLLDDGKLLILAADSRMEDTIPTDSEKCPVRMAYGPTADGARPLDGSLAGTVLRGGLLESRKSLAVVGKTISLPALTDHDLKNLSIAKELGVTGVMLPFVRSRQDLLDLRAALSDAGIPGTRIFAKIENLAGVEHLEELIPEADEIVIARGDLGNSMPLWELPRVQKQIQAACRKKGRPFMVVTQMLDSMCRLAVPTRAEVMDVFQAVLDGASSVMLTGETAAGKYPVEAMTYLVNTGREALRFPV